MVKKARKEMTWREALRIGYEISMIMVSVSFVYLLYFIFVQNPTTAYYIGDYVIHELNIDDALGLDGQTQNKVIILDDTMTDDRRYQVCNHEVCHNIVQRWMLNMTLENEEKLCDMIDDYTNFVECDIYMEVRENGYE